MKVPVSLSNAFGKTFEDLIGRFATERGLLPGAESLNSQRFLARSVIPHVVRLSAVFNRLEMAKEVLPDHEELGQVAVQSPRGARPRWKAREDAGGGVDKYWNLGSNPDNLRLAYFLYFMPSNLYRVASVWAELARLGYRWSPKGPLRAIEFGAGPASGACGIAAGERHAPVGIPETGNWALIEQDRKTLELGSEWAKAWFADNGKPDWDTRLFHRTIDFKRPLLPPSAPKFNLWVASYFLNEAEESATDLAARLVDAWDRHLDDEGIVILVEPALRLQSRRLLELRQAILDRLSKPKAPPMQILLPCMGHQNCGALAGEGDWCHEEVSWMRPPYFKRIDEMAGLDRKSLPFSYLVLVRSRRPREEILPGIGPAAGRERLVSPAHKEGKEWEFFHCGEQGKRRSRYRPSGPEDPGAELERGDILVGSESRGDVNAGRIDSFRRKIEG